MQPISPAWLKKFNLKSFLFLFSLLFLVGCGGLRQAQIVTYDLICLKGEEVNLKAKLETSGFIKDNIKNETLAFYDEHGRLISEGKTKKKGVFETRYKPNSNGFIHIQTKLKSEKYQAQTASLLVRAAEPETKFIVVDIDNTISNLSPILMLISENADIPPVEGAPETLQRLAEEYTIIYMTGRDDSLAPKTKEWLKHYGFPEGPVFFWDFMHTPLSKRKYKSELIDQIGRKFELIQIGIGNSVGDAVAYVSNGLQALILLSPEEKKRADQLPRGAKIVGSWEEIQKQFF